MSDHQEIPNGKLSREELDKQTSIELKQLFDKVVQDSVCLNCGKSAKEFTTPQAKELYDNTGICELCQPNFKDINALLDSAKPDNVSMPFEEDFFQNVVAMVQKMQKEAEQAKQTNTCAGCTKPITEFRNTISQKEYTISGLCQECQDSVFGVD